MARVWEVCAPLSCGVDTLVFGVRAPLVFGSQTRHLDLLSKVKSLIEHAQASGVQCVLHVSSVAVMDHLVAQDNVSEVDPLPPLAKYKGQGTSYDYFKRMCEDLISEVCEAKRMEYCHLRISGIFSNPSCIQMSTLKMQAYIGVNIQNSIDFNSSLNTCVAMSLIMTRMRAPKKTNKHPCARVYLYTRSTPKPVSYGDLILSYRNAHSIAGLWLPMWVMTLFLCVSQIGFLLMRLTRVPAISSLAESLEYLLGVVNVSHTFDNSLFKLHFPEILKQEESTDACFRRVREKHGF
jgi:hypothetical protein